MVSSELNKGWDIRGFFYIQDQQVLLHSGFPDKASYMGVRQRLAVDDFIEITAHMNLQKFQVSNLDVAQSDQKINAMVFQFASTPTPADLTFQTADYLDLQGLAIFILNQDRSTPENPNHRPYYVTYKYFPKRTRLIRDYFSMLIENIRGITS